MTDDRSQAPGSEGYETLSSALAGTLGALPDLLAGTALAGEADQALGLNTADWLVVDCVVEAGSLVPIARENRTHPVWQQIAATGPVSPAGGSLVLDAHLAFVLAAAEDRPARILVKSDRGLLEGVEGMLEPGEQLTGAEFRLLKYLLCGVGLSMAARIDQVSHETRRSQYKSLARKLGARSQTELSSRVLPQVLFDGALLPLPGGAANGEVFVDLAREFLPEARTFVLHSRGGTRHRFIDMGPVSGRPVVMVHSQILPDFRPQDIDLLTQADIRFVVPLRNGAMAGTVPPTDSQAHLEHACEGIELAISHFAGDSAHLLVCVSGCAYGVEFAHRFADKVRSMAFVGACVKPESGPGLAGRMRAGLLTLARSHWQLLSKALLFYGRRIRHPVSLRRFLRRHYAPNPSDLAVVNAEYNGPHAGERGRKLLSASLESIKHDLYYQAMPHWDRFPCNRFPAAFFHGAKDFIHPIADVHALAGSFGDVPVHAIPDAGQLLYHHHFEPMLRRYMQFLSAAESSRGQAPSVSPNRGIQSPDSGC